MCGLTKCSRCNRLHKDCLPVPSNFFSRLNDLLTLADAVTAGDNVNDVLESGVVSYTKDVEAHMRVASRRGLKKKPDNTVEVGLLILDQLERMATVMERLCDTIRGPQSDSELLSRTSSSEEEEDDAMSDEEEINVKQKV